MTLKDRIKSLCKEKGISVSKMERDCGFANGYISKLDKSTPNTAKIQIIADYFGVSTEYLITGESPTGYYYDEETMQIAQEIYQNEDLHMLFDLTKDASSDEIKDFAQVILLMQKRERHED